eukprot:366189-Chlamydomonas_euryale.AAC.2
MRRLFAACGSEARGFCLWHVHLGHQAFCLRRVDHRHQGGESISAPQRVCALDSQGVRNSRKTDHSKQ